MDLKASYNLTTVHKQPESVIEKSEKKKWTRFNELCALFTSCHIFRVFILKFTNIVAKTLGEQTKESLLIWSSD